MTTQAPKPLPLSEQSYNDRQVEQLRNESHTYVVRRLLATIAHQAEQIAKVQARYQWAANELLACDYGDNATPKSDKKMGWIVHGWRHRPYELWQHNDKPRIYGPTIDEAIDAALTPETRHEHG